MLLLTTGIARHPFVDHLVDQDRLRVACGLSLFPAWWRDDQAIGPDFDHHVRHPAEHLHDARQMLAENRGSLRLGAAKPDVLSDRVPSPATGELSVVGDEDRAAVGGVDGEGVVRGVVEVRLARRPALVAGVEKDSADGDGDVVV